MKKGGLIILVAVAVAAVVGFMMWSKKPGEKPAVQQPVAQQPYGQQPVTQRQTAVDTVKLATMANNTRYLVDEKGMALYYFTRDNIDKSNCAVGPCLTAWPIFYNANIKVAAPLNQNDFATITRSDGEKQTTYKGWPLYYFFKDAKPSDVLGEDVNKAWYVMTEPFYTVMVQTQDAVQGNYLVDKVGKTLYYFTKDTQGTSTSAPDSKCSGVCLEKWPVFDVKDINVPSILKKSDFSVLSTKEGKQQVVYKGWPLYYFAGDTQAGDLKGQDVNKAWYVVKP